MPTVRYGCRKTLAQAHFAVPQAVVLDELQPEVAGAFQRSLQCLSQAGARIEFIPATAFAELAAINADGGFTALESWRWHQALIAERADGYDPGYCRAFAVAHPGDADLQLLQRQRADWQRRVTAELQRFDAVLMPAVPMIAPTIGELAADDAYFRCNGLMLRNPAIINFLDGCALSLPCQQPGEAPVGLMLAGLPMRDEALLGWALAIERCLADA